MSKPVVVVDFAKVLQQWDGFGINYVQTAQTRDPSKSSQDYGGFDILTEKDRGQIIDLVFGDDGLQPSIAKMFLDPFHIGMIKPDWADNDPATFHTDKYDHGLTTGSMLQFIRQGAKLTAARKETLSVLATLYGPPGWMTLQKVVRGRDIDPGEKVELARYMLAFVKYLREQENISVNYLAFFNEGDLDAGRKRWPPDGGDPHGQEEHDYNMLWTPELVAEFLAFMPDMMNRWGLGDVGLCGGEYTVLDFAVEYAEAILRNERALESFGLFVSHGFGEHIANFNDKALSLLQSKNPDLKGWITSATWGRKHWAPNSTEMSLRIQRHIYRSKISGYIPWAAVQRHSQWVGGDPNPRCAIQVFDNGTWQVQPEYYQYKQWCPFARAGMQVCAVESTSSFIAPAAFASAKGIGKNVVVLTNCDGVAYHVNLTALNAGGSSCRAWITSPHHIFERLPDVTFTDGVTEIELPGQSVMTLQLKD